MIITIFRIQSYNGHHEGVYYTKLTLEEKKEEIVNQLIDKGKPFFLLDNFKLKGEESFNLIELEELYCPEQKEVLDKFEKYKKEYAEIKLKQLHSNEFLFKPTEKIVFSDIWTKYSRPSLITSKSNPILKELSEKLKLNIEDSIDIIKNLSLFTIENMKIHEPTRIPYIGAFKIKKSKVVQLKNLEYGTVRIRRRIWGSESEQDLD